MNNERVIKQLRTIADRIEAESRETVRYLGEDGNVHVVPVNVRVLHLPRVANQRHAIVISS